MIVVDSDVLIDALRGREPSATRIRTGLDASDLATTTISTFELLSGAPTRRIRERVERLLAGLSILPFDADAAEAAAAARRELERQGRPIGMADYLIAGICLARSAALLTRNRAHFARVPGLNVVEP